MDHDAYRERSGRRRGVGALVLDDVLGELMARVDAAGADLLGAWAWRRKDRAGGQMTLYRIASIPVGGVGVEIAKRRYRPWMLLRVSMGSRS